MVIQKLDQLLTGSAEPQAQKGSQERMGKASIKGGQEKSFAQEVKSAVLENNSDAKEIRKTKVNIMSLRLAKYKLDEIQTQKFYSLPLNIQELLNENGMDMKRLLSIDNFTSEQAVHFLCTLQIQGLKF